jgi:hypothetical protein
MGRVGAALPQALRGAYSCRAPKRFSMAAQYGTSTIRLVLRQINGIPWFHALALAQIAFCPTTRSSGCAGETCGCDIWSRS